MRTFREFLLWERTTRDTIDFKKVYVDVADDLIAGLMLSQIIYWHLPTKDGNSKMKVKKDGFTWIAKAHADWYDEIRVTEWQAPRALKILEERGIIEKRLYKFDGSPTVHIRIIEDRFLELLSELVNDQIPFEGKTKIQSGERLDSLTKTTTKITSENLKDSQPSAGISLIEWQEQQKKLQEEKKKNVPQTPHRLMVEALRQVTEMDMKIKTNAGRIVRASKQLREAGYTYEDIEEFGRKWKQDWRYQKDKKPPALTVIIAEIKKIEREDSPDERKRKAIEQIERARLERGNN
jgi:hypothetical protein